MTLLKRVLQPWPEPAVALLAQLAALLLSLVGVVPVVEYLGISLSFSGSALLGGVLAALVGRAVGLSPWWLPINLAFWPAIVLAYSLAIRPAWFLVGFGLLLAVYWSVVHSRVPFYLTGSKALGALARLLPAGRSFRFVDLGAGTGRVLRRLAVARPEGEYLGIESAPLPFLAAYLRCAVSPDRWRMQWGNFWHADLARYDVIYAYLSPAPMADLLRKLQAEMKPGSLFISNTFALPGVMPAETAELPDIHRSTLYLYRYDDIIGTEKDRAG